MQVQKSLRTKDSVEEYHIPPIGKKKKRNLTFKEIDWLITGIKVAKNTPPDEKQFKSLLERFKGMFSVTSVMVLVKKGNFQMGNTQRDIEAHPDENVHSVTLSDDFYIGKYQVTFNEYDVYCKETGKASPNDAKWGRWLRPVINVSWNDALDYCNWLSENQGLAKAYDNEGNLLDKEGEQTTNITKVEGYRLPTEAEWEYAAKGGHKSTVDYKYAGSNDIDSVAWYKDNSKNKTQEVGQKAPNELNLYDMNGNIWEWCIDSFNECYSHKVGSENPVNLDDSPFRVVRGFSSFESVNHVRISVRSCINKGDSTLSAGFRIVRKRQEDTHAFFRIPDPGLEGAIRESKGYTGQSNGPMNPTDVNRIIRLYAVKLEISSLEAIRYLEKLINLQLNQNNIVKILPLQNLSKLQELNLEKNRIQNLYPLNILPRLKQLNLSHNQLEYLEKLEKSKSLFQLDLSNNSLYDIRGLKDLTAIKKIKLTNNEIRNITPLASNTNLGDGVTIDLRYNLLDLRKGQPAQVDIKRLKERGVRLIFKPQKPLDMIFSADEYFSGYSGYMVSVKKGIFRMGFENDDPNKEFIDYQVVKLSYDYYIGKYQVTFKQYDAYCEATGKEKPDDHEWGRENRPVINISWNDAINYCNWLSENQGLAKAYDNKGNLLDKEGKKTTDMTKVEGVRLPTEAEWEYAARGGRKSMGDFKYSGTNNISTVAWWSANSNGTSHEIGQKAPNEMGLYDMSGNVWEWCYDYWDENYYQRSPLKNPVNCKYDECRIIRGGGFNNSYKNLLVFNRDSENAEYCNETLGMRVARTRK